MGLKNFKNRMAKLTRPALLLGLAAMLSACTSVSEKNRMDWMEDYPITSGIVRFKPVNFDDLPKTEKEDWMRAMTAFRASCSRMAKRSIWRDVCADVQFVNEDSAYDFFKDEFQAYRVSYADEKDPKGFKEEGLTTGYYEPMLRGSLTKTQVYRYPIYSIPDDLIQVDLTELHPQLKGLRLRGKVVGRKLVPYDKRSTLEKREDLKEKHVLCWVDDPVEAFFLQIQGSGRILLPDGSFMRVGYGDQNGHPYKALGTWLIQNAGLTRSEMSMQRIKQWVKDNPARMQELLNTNPNFVFFEERVGFSPEDGPLGAQSVPLTASSSVAVDRRYWPMGVPFVIDIKQDNPEMRFARPVVAQDTGGAIRGPLRFDYFWGYGDAAGSIAGGQQSQTVAWVLVPKGYGPADLK